MINTPDFFLDFLKKEGKITREREKNYVEEQIARIGNLCKPYLRLLKGFNIPTPFIRGMIHQNDIGIKDTREDRITRGMRDDIAFVLNNFLEDNGHLRRDMNVVIATSDPHIAKYHGRMYYIYPIGKVNYTFITLDDINFSINDLRDEEIKNLSTEIVTAREQLHMGTITPTLKKAIFTDKNLDVAYIRKYEIWFKCMKYFYVNEDNFQIYKEQFDELMKNAR